MRYPIEIKPVPCAHIHKYYEFKQFIHKCIANNALRIGYRQWCTGLVEEHNNLYDVPE